MKVALITGGSSGIGRATALAFMKAGVRVAVASRGAKRGQAVVREIEEAGGEAMFVQTDVANAASIRTMVEQTVARFGRVDYAVNNAALAEEPLAMMADFSEEQFDRSIAMNLKSVWLSMRYEIPQMLKQDPAGGAIVNTSSVNGLGGVQRASLYAAAKAGVISLSKSAALEYAKKGIRVNALVAGGFDTPMLNEMIDRAAGGNAAGREAVLKAYHSMVPLGRIGNPDEAAQAIVWLCSDAASYVTGHSMIVDGGWTASMR